MSTKFYCIFLYLYHNKYRNLFTFLTHERLVIFHSHLFAYEKYNSAFYLMPKRRFWKKSHLFFPIVSSFIVLKNNIKLHCLTLYQSFIICETQ